MVGDNKLHSVVPRVFLTSLFVLGFTPLFIANLSLCSAEEKREYLSQTYIDTVISRAYFKLNAADDPGSGIERVEAIEYAKGIVKKMKRLAENDPNRKYILWKVGELESLLYLEESGLLEEQEKMRINSMNDLVERYNAEVARKRPDFSNLAMIHQRMNGLDDKKAQEIFKSIVDRQKNISIEIIQAIELSLEKKDFNTARKDLVYCQMNRQYLTLSLTKYAQLSAQLEAQISVDKELEFVDNSFSSIEKLIEKERLGEAADLTQIISLRLDHIKKKTIPREWDKRFFQNKRMIRKIEQKEDALVKANLKVLETDGIFAAAKYMDKELRSRGVSPIKLATIDRQITRAAIDHANKEDTTLRKELNEISAAPETDLIVDDMLAAAKLMAKAKTNQNSLTTEEKAKLTQIEEVRRTRMSVKKKGEIQRQQDKKAENEKKARESVLEIYTLLEKRKRDQAREQFAQTKEFLKTNLSAKDFASLDSAVAKGNVPRKKRQRRNTRTRSR